MNDLAEQTGPVHGEPSVTARWILGAALVYAAATRIVYLLWAADHSPYFLSPISDALMYHRWALEIVHGKLLSDHAFYQAPLYPYFLGAVYYLFGSDPWPIRLIQALLGLGNILLIYLVARRPLPPVWAAMAAALAALYFGFAFHESFLLLETLGLHLFLWSLLLALRATESGRPMAWALAGLTVGLACLARPNILLLLPMLALWLLIACRRAVRPALVCVAALFAGAALAILPATLHNWRVGHEFALVTTNAGTTFVFGNNPAATGTIGLPPGFSGNILTQRQEELAVAQQALKQPLTQSDAARHWLHQGLRFLIDNPGAAIHLEYLKFRRLISDVEFPDNYSMRDDLNPYKSLMPLSFAIIFGLAIWGMATAPWRSHAVQLYAIFLAVPVATVLIFYMTARYRLPALPNLIVFASLGLRSVAQLATERRWPKLALAASVAGLAATTSFMPMPQYDGPATWRVREAVAWLQADRPDRALDHLALARAANPDEKGLWLNTALAYYKENRLPQALEAANRALDVEPETVKPEIVGLEGAILLGLKEYATAEHILKQAIELAPGNGKFHLALAILYHRTGRPAAAQSELRSAEANGAHVPIALQQMLNPS